MGGRHAKTTLANHNYSLHFFLQEIQFNSITPFLLAVLNVCLKYKCLQCNYDMPEKDVKFIREKIKIEEVQLTLRKVKDLFLLGICLKRRFFFFFLWLSWWSLLLELGGFIYMFKAFIRGGHGCSFYIISFLSRFKKKNLFHYLYIFPP